MKSSLKVFFKIIIIFVGVLAFAFMLWEPHLEGRNTHATVFQIYFNDPFLAYAYIASIPFFVALYQAFKAVGYPQAKSFRIIKYCAVCIISFVALGKVFILMNNSDDRAGGVFMGILITLGSILMAEVAAKLERRYN